MYNFSVNHIVHRSPPMRIQQSRIYHRVPLVEEKLCISKAHETVLVPDLRRSDLCLMTPLMEDTKQSTLIVSYRERLDKAMQDNIALAQSLKDRNDALERTELELQRLQSEQCQYKSMVATPNYKVMYEDKQREITALSAAKEDCIAELKQRHEQTMAQKEEQHQSQRREWDEQSKQREIQLTEQLEQMISERERTNKQWTQTEAQLQSEVSKLKREISALQQALKDEKESKLVPLIEEQNEQQEQHQLKLSHAAGQLDRSQKEVQLLRGKIRDYVDQLQQTNTLRQLECSKSEECLRATEEQKQQLEDHLAFLQGVIQQKEASINEQNKVQSRLQGDLRSLAASLDEALAENVKLKNEKVQQETLNSKLQAANSEHQAKLVAHQEEAKRNLEQVINRYEEEMKQLGSTHTNRIRELQTARENDAFSLRRAEREVVELKSELADIETTQQRTSRASDQLLREADALRDRQQKESGQQIESLKDQLHTLSQQHDKLQGMYKSLITSSAQERDSLLEYKAQYEHQLDQATFNFMQLEQLVQEKDACLASERGLASNQLSLLAQKNEELSANLNSALREIESLTSRHAQVMEHHQEATNNAERLNQSLNEYHEQLEQRGMMVEQLQNEIKRWVITHQELEEEALLLQRQNETLFDQLERVQHQKVKVTTKEETQLANLRLQAEIHRLNTIIEDLQSKLYPPEHIPTNYKSRKTTS